MRTITDEVGSGPIEIFNYAAEEQIGSYKEEEILDKPRLDCQGRAARSSPEGDHAKDVDGKRVCCELNPKGSAAPLGRLAHTVDNGPNPPAANDNDTSSRTTSAHYRTTYPLKEMYQRLGFNDLPITFRRCLSRTTRRWCTVTVH
jgi:hypothetical protein